MTFKTRRLSSDQPSRVIKTSKQILPIASAGLRIVVGYYQRWKAHRAHEAHMAILRVWLKRILVGLIGVLLVLLIFAGTVKALVSLKILSPQMFFSVAGSELPEDPFGQTNFLLLGVGDKNHDGVDLTDSLMVVSVDNKHSKSISMLSLPRDLYLVKTRHMGTGRVNEMYRNYKYYLRRTLDPKPSLEQASQLAMRELADELGIQLGLQIHHVIKVDFTAFTDTVDALGGIDINVPEAIYDPEYPGANYGYEIFQLEAGPQHIDGETALKYARSRHSTSDFSRSARQQILLQALADKAKTEGVMGSPGKLASLMKILTDHIETTMNARELIGLGALGKNLDREHMINISLSNVAAYEGGLPQPGGLLYNPPMADFGGASVLLPYAITQPNGNWLQLETLMRMITRKRNLYLAHPQFAVLNASDKTGLARVAAAELIRFGFRVDTIENLSEDRKDPAGKREKSMLLWRNEADKDLAAELGALLRLPVAQVDPTLPAEKLGQFTIILGQDYIFLPFQLLLDPPPAPTGASSSPTP